MDDHGDTRDLATLIGLGETLSGSVSREAGTQADRDVFSFNVNAGDRYQFTISQTSGFPGTLTFARAEIIGPDGASTQVDLSLDGPVVISGIAQASGIQSIELFSSRGLGIGRSLDYTVRFDTLTPDTVDDHSDAREGATRLLNGQAVTGVLDDPNDVDVFEIDIGNFVVMNINAEKTSGSDGLTIQVFDSDPRLVFRQEPIVEVYSGATVTESFYKTVQDAFGLGTKFIAISGPRGAYELMATRPNQFREPNQVFDIDRMTDFSGTNGERDVFFMQKDSTRDLVRQFEFGLDRIDVSEFGAEELSDLTITNATNRFGKTTWVDIAGPEGVLEISLRFGDGTPLDASALSASDFIFAPTTARTGGLNQADTAAVDSFRGVAGAELYQLQDDGLRDLIRGFEFGLDRIDVSAFAASFEDLTIVNQTRRDGSVNWINVSDLQGETEVAVRFGDGTPMDAGALTAQDFVFANGPITRDREVLDRFFFDKLTGSNGIDRFIMLDDGVRDLIRGFDVGTDRIDVSAFASSFDELTISNQTRADGSVNWVTITDFYGQAEMAVHFASGAMDASRLSEDSFIFSEEPFERAPLVNILTDTDRRTDLRATAGHDVFLMQDDDASDIIRGFEPGVDKIDLTDFDGLIFSTVRGINQLRKDGSVRWVEVYFDRLDRGVPIDAEPDFLVRFNPGTPTDLTSFQQEDFIFF